MYDDMMLLLAAAVYVAGVNSRDELQHESGLVHEDTGYVVRLVLHCTDVVMRQFAFLIIGCKSSWGGRVQGTYSGILHLVYFFPLSVCCCCCFFCMNDTINFDYEVNLNLVRPVNKKKVGGGRDPAETLTSLRDYYTTTEYFSALLCCMSYRWCSMFEEENPGHLHLRLLRLPVAPRYEYNLEISGREERIFELKIANMIL